MKILLVSPHFHPENFKCNDTAFELVKRGHEVTVLTAIPDYPLGRYFDGYGVWKKRSEVVNGVKVIRSLLIPRGNGNKIRLALNYLSFAFFSSLRALCLAYTQKFDAVLVHQLSPVTVGIPAVLVKKIQRIPLYFWVLDLWPESLSAAGNIQNKYMLGTFLKLTTWMYRNSEKILMSSMGFGHSIKEKGDFEKKLVYFPNWADSDLVVQQDYPLPELPKGFIVMFAGNIGEAQDFDHIMEAALRLKEHKDIHFVILGNGRKREWVEQYVQQNGLEETVHLLGQYPLKAMSSFFNRADAMLVSLKDVPIFALTAPAKIQAYMSASRPILAMMNGEGARMVEEAKCGLSVNAGDAAGLAERILQLYHSDKAALNEMGMNGYVYCMQHFEFTKCMDHLCDILNVKGE